MVEYIGPERRKASKDERRRFAEENDMAQDGTLKLTLSVRSFVLIVTAVLGLSGGGSIVYQRAVAKEPTEQQGLIEALRGARADHVRLAVIESQMADVKARVERLDFRGEDTNRVVRLLAHDKGINPDAR